MEETIKDGKLDSTEIMRETSDDDESYLEECVRQDKEDAFDPGVSCDVEINEEEQSFSFVSPSVQNIAGFGSIIQTDVDRKGFTQIGYVPESRATCRISQKFRVKQLASRFICNYCSYYSHTLRCIETHMSRKHHDNLMSQLNDNSDINMIECSKCSETFNSRWGHENHYALIHPIDEKLYSCHYCNYKGNRMYLLKKHIFTRHLGKFDTNHENYFQCHLCKYVAAFERPLYQHFKKVHNITDNYICTVCRKQFTSYAMVKRHRLENHSKEGYYSCKMCDFTTKVSYNLYSHVNTFHIVDAIKSTMTDLT